MGLSDKLRLDTTLEEIAPSSPLQLCCCACCSVFWFVLIILFIPVSFIEVTRLHFGLCVLGFAVLNVVNAVFVQQTMRTASSDEELAYKQRQKEIALYTKKARRLFQNMDSTLGRRALPVRVVTRRVETGDGAINLEEFSKLVQSPKLKFWMSQLELEYHDLLSLFEFLDNGDGHITLTEFIDGAARLRGGAKAIDVWRLETKLEVLFEEALSARGSSPCGSMWVISPGG
eukprot:g17187.t1